MNPHQTCQTCQFNISAVCANEASRYFKSPLKSWNTCSSHTAPLPSPAELCARLEACALALEHLSNHSGGEYSRYWHDRAAQCRSWLADVKEGHRVGDEDIVAGLREFEAMAL